MTEVRYVYCRRPKVTYTTESECCALFVHKDATSDKECNKGSTRSLLHSHPCRFSPNQPPATPESLP